MKKIYNDRKVVYEVVAAINTGYYEDERVLLKDLLYPNYSPLYKKEGFIKTKAEKGITGKAFFNQLNKGDYPNLKKALTPANIPTRPNQDNQRSDGAPDPAMEIFSNSDGISIYFPYSENFGSIFTPEYFDNINTDPRGNLATVVAADREADEAPGYEPYVCGTRDEQELCYQIVTVNDAYAEFHVTHIVGVGAEPTIIANHDPSNPVQNHLVFIGDVKCINQYDRFISLSGNGGGSELRFIRGDGFLMQSSTGQITDPKETVEVDIKRKYIKGGTWRTILSIWDPNWEVDNKEQVFGIYEEDTESTITFSGSVQTTLTFTGGSTQIGPIGFSIVRISKDPIVRQIEWDRQSFYLYNRGTLNNGCGTRNGWTVYDCGVNVMYTMPEQ